MSCRNLLRIVPITAPIAGLLFASAAHAELTFTYDYSGNAAGVGFLDPVDGPARRAALVTAGQRFGTLFNSHFTNSATIAIAVTSDNVGLASAGSFIAGDIPGFGNGDVVRVKVLSNGADDITGSGNDGFVNVNFSGGFNYQLDPNAPVDYNGGQIDFFSVIAHEFTHALGFGSNIPADGIVGPGYAFSKLDQFISSRTLGPVVVGGVVNLAAYVDAQTNGGVFVGPNAIAAFNDSAGVPLEVNASISHLNQTAFTFTTTTLPGSQVPFNALMRPSSTPPDFFVPRAYVPAEIGILTDIGYTAVPEPTSLSMIVVGTSALVARRRRKVTA